MDVTLTVTVSVPDNVGTFLGFSSMAVALKNNISQILSDLQADNPDIVEGFSIESAGSEESGSDEIVSRPAAPQRPVARKPRTDAVVPAATHNPSGRMGRPATLHDMEASDGGPVRAHGSRGEDALKDEGIAVRRVGAANWPKWYERLNAVTVEDDPRPSKASNAASFVVRKRGK